MSILSHAVDYIQALQTLLEENPATKPSTTTTTHSASSSPAFSPHHVPLYPHQQHGAMGTMGRMGDVMECSSPCSYPPPLTPISASPCYYPPQQASYTCSLPGYRSACVISPLVRILSKCSDD